MLVPLDCKETSVSYQNTPEGLTILAIYSPLCLLYVPLANPLPSNKRHMV